MSATTDTTAVVVVVVVVIVIVVVNCQSYPRIPVSTRDYGRLAEYENNHVVTFIIEIMFTLTRSHMLKINLRYLEIGNWIIDIHLNFWFLLFCFD